MSESAISVLRDGGLLPETPGNQAITDQDMEMEWAGLDDVFSGRPDAVKFDTIGDTVTFTIVSGSTRQKRKFEAEANSTNPDDLVWWPDGRPRMEAVLEVMTPEGMRTLYFSSWRLENAFQTALKDAGVRGPRPGGRGVIRYTADEEVYANGKKTGRSAKVFDAAYEPPGRKSLDQQLAGRTEPVQEPLSLLDSEPPF